MQEIHVCVNAETDLLSDLMEKHVRVSLSDVMECPHIACDRYLNNKKVKQWAKPLFFYYLFFFCYSMCIYLILYEKMSRENPVQSFKKAGFA